MLSLSLGITPLAVQSTTPPVSYSAEATAYFARMSVQPSAPTKSAIDTCITALVASGAWALLDCLQIYGLGQNLTDAYLNLKGASFTAATLAGTPTLFPGYGIYTNGTTDAVDTGFAPASGVNFQQSNASLMYWSRIISGIAAPSIVNAGATSTTQIIPRTTGNQVGVRLNFASTVAFTNTSGFGLMGGNISGTSVNVFVNGASVGTTTRTSTAPAAVNMLLGKNNAAFVEQQHLFFAVGSSLTTGQWTAVYSAVSTLFTYLGITVGYDKTVTTPTLPQIAHVKMPALDEAIVGGGYPCTGWDASPAEATRWGGWGVAGDNVGGGLMHLSAPANPASDPTVTALAHYPTATIFAAVSGYTASTSGAANTYPPGSTTQGVWVDKTMSESTYDIWWIAVGNSTLKAWLCRGTWNGTTVVGISCTVLPSGTINGVCRDKRGDWWAIDLGPNLLYKCAVDASGVLTIPSSPFTTSADLSSGGGSLDQVNYYPVSDQVCVSGGSNGSDAKFLVIPVLDISFSTRRYVRQLYTVTSVTAAEGAYINSAGYLEYTSDQATHSDATFPFNNLAINGPINIA